jgi:hypothetical protein
VDGIFAHLDTAAVCSQCEGSGYVCDRCEVASDDCCCGDFDTFLDVECPKCSGTGEYSEG